MVEIKLEPNLEDLKTLSNMFSAGLTEAALPNTAGAMQQAIYYTQNVWTGYLAGENSLNGIDHIDKVNRSIIQSIKNRKNHDFDYTVYSDSQELKKAVEGSKDVDFDMKKTHPYGRKSRKNAKGIPYLIIPFRWGTPNGKGTKRRWSNVIPQATYNTTVKALKLSEVLHSTHIEKNAKGDKIKRAEYIWGSRLKLDEGDRMNGLVRMKDITGSTYFTFRIISAASPQGSWIYHRDGKPAVDMIGALKKTVESSVNEMIKQGLKDDVEALKNGQ